MLLKKKGEIPPFFDKIKSAINENYKEKNMILVTGANGQLGTELRHLLDERNEEYVAVDVAEMDITDAAKVDEVLRK